MELVLARCRIRSWRPGDEPSLAHHANDRRVWRNLRDRFPHPYTLADAQRWVTCASAAEPETAFAIEVAGEPAGGIGLALQEDVGRGTAELGYWLGAAHWGRGIMSEAVGAFSDYAFEALALRRIYAQVYVWNPASARVLERAGYILEGRLRASVLKDGEVVDQWMYGRCHLPPASEASPG